MGRTDRHSDRRMDRQTKVSNLQTEVLFLVVSWTFMLHSWCCCVDTVTFESDWRIKRQVLLAPANPDQVESLSSSITPTVALSNVTVQDNVVYDGFNDKGVHTCFYKSKIILAQRNITV